VLLPLVTSTTTTHILKPPNIRAKPLNMITEAHRAASAAFQNENLKGTRSLNLSLRSSDGPNIFEFQVDNCGLTRTNSPVGCINTSPLKRLTDAFLLVQIRNATSQLLL
jgi:hypothetical protein